MGSWLAWRCAELKSHAAMKRRGRDKKSAYRGFRTVILHQVLIGHEVACAWAAADAETRRKLHIVADDCTKEFVSQAQTEIGR
jgi:hypothetical protein